MTDEELEARVVELAQTLYGDNCRIIHSEGSLNALSIDQKTTRGYYTKVTYFGDIKIPLTQSTKRERLEQAHKDLTIRLHNRITEIKGVLAKHSSA